MPILTSKGIRQFFQEVFGHPTSKAEALRRITQTLALKPTQVLFFATIFAITRPVSLFFLPSSHEKPTHFWSSPANMSHRKREETNVLYNTAHGSPNEGEAAELMLRGVTCREHGNRLLPSIDGHEGGERTEDNNGARSHRKALDTPLRGRSFRRSPLEKCENNEGGNDGFPLRNEVRSAVYVRHFYFFYFFLWLQALSKRRQTKDLVLSPSQDRTTSFPSQRLQRPVRQSAGRPDGAI